VVACADAAVELEGEAADGRTVLELLVVVDVGAAEAFDAHAAEVLAGLDEDDGAAFSGCLHGGDDASAGAAVDADVCLSGGVERQREKGGEDEEAACHGWPMRGAWEVVLDGEWRRSLKFQVSSLKLRGDGIGRGRLTSSRGRHFGRERRGRKLLVIISGNVYDPYCWT